MIIIYSTDNCVYCKKAKKYFKEHNIEYIDKDVFKDLEARDEMINKSGQMSVPVIDVNGRLMVGFDLMRFNELMNKGTIV